MKKILLPLMALPLIAAAPVFPDRAGRGVVDSANVIPDNEERALNQKVVAWEKATHHQLAVVTVPDMQGYDIKDFSNQMFRSYGLGRKEQNDGVLLLLAMKERKARIEVGYGLEGQLTDGTTFLILKEAIVPELKSGDVVGALNIGVDNIIANVKAEVAAPVKQDRGGNGWWWLLGLIGLGSAGLLVTSHVMLRRRREKEEAERRARLAFERAEDDRRRQARERDRVVESRPVRHVPPTPPYRPTPTPTPTPTPVRRRERERDVYVAPVPIPTPTPSPSPSYDWGSSSSSSSSSSSDSSSSSSSSYDSGGGSSGGGGSDSSW